MIDVRWLSPDGPIAVIVNRHTIVLTPAEAIELRAKIQDATAKRARRSAGETEPTA